jgi:hypothetical protein
MGMGLRIAETLDKVDTVLNLASSLLLFFLQGLGPLDLDV